MNRELLIGDWHSAFPENLSDFFTLRADGTGCWTVNEITGIVRDEFQWNLSSSGDYLIFQPVANAFSNEFLSNGSFKIRLEQGVPRGTNRCDVLSLSIWCDAVVVEGNGTRLEYPAEWTSATFWRFATN
jgi:hypothetical protein